ncbi:MAG: hypothetical protein IV088_15405 [Hydrogenophaga sp.]|uniref:hypothetical protein n=1 Tax=Hydrogenophaga sp. TaxID=1904254 RepID=UPI0025BBAD35|nr:hypothetical protein [Hydrogenophaga sp.]MBT9552235.1 hypothetical protein [Hydrogenophaga sp.]
MKKFAILIMLLLPIRAFSQWAVLDEEVRKLLEQINRVKSIGDKKLQDFDQQALFSEDFAAVSVSNPERYVKSMADCGDKNLNLNHYNACLGLRNLQLKTLDQTEAIVVRIRDRRTKIRQLVDAARGTKPDTEAGQLQRYQFELQGVQAQMQNDAMELEALRYGYKQREHMYEMQMAEARRATDTRPPGGAAGGINLGTVPFFRK